MNSKRLEIIQATWVRGYNLTSIAMMVAKMNALTNHRYDVQLLRGKMSVITVVPGLAYLEGTDVSALEETISGFSASNNNVQEALDVVTTCSLRWAIDDFMSIYCDPDRRRINLSSSDVENTSPLHLGNIISMLGAVKKDLRSIAVIRAVL